MSSTSATSRCRLNTKWDMAAMSGMTPDEPEGIAVKPGQTKELTTPLGRPVRHSRGARCRSLQWWHEGRAHHRWIAIRAMDHHEHHQQGVPKPGEPLQGATDAPHAAGHGQHAAGGHDKHAGHSVAMFRDKFWLSLALTIPVILLSHDIQEWFGYTIPPVPRHRVRAGDPRHDHLPLRRDGLHPRCPGRIGRPQARDDDPHLAGHHRRLRDLVGGHARASSRSRSGGSWPP